MANSRDIEQLLLSDPNAEENKILAAAQKLLDLKNYKDCHLLLDSLVAKKDLPNSIKAKAYRLKVICFVKSPNTPKVTPEAINHEIRKMEVLHDLALRLNAPAFDADVNYFFADWHYAAKPVRADKAFAYALRAVEGNNNMTYVKDRLQCGFICGYISQQNKDNVSGLKYYEFVINLYISISSPAVLKTIDKVPSSCVAKAAANAAMLLDTFEENKYPDVTPDPAKLLRCYELAAAFNIDYCIHNLGYKYEYGENVEKDIEKAIEYYTTAAKLGYAESINNLFCLSFTEKRNVADILPMMHKVQGHAKIYHDLGYYYFQLAVKSKYINSPSITANYLGLSHKYFSLGRQCNHPGSMANLGLMYEDGLGVSENLVIAEKYYQEAIAHGAKEALSHLAFLYNKKLLLEKNPKKQKHLLQQAHARYIEARLIPKTVSINDIAALEKITADLQKKYRRQCIGLNQNITATAGDYQASMIARIEKLLYKDVNTMNVVNVVTVIHRIGALTEKSLDKRDFHSRQRVAISNLLARAKQFLESDIFDLRAKVNLVEGISKLYWISDNELINRLYHSICSAKEIVSARELVTLIFAMTRLSCEGNQFHHLIGTMLKNLMPLLKDLDLSDLSSLSYAMAILHCKSQDFVVKKNIHALLTFLSKNLVETEVYLQSCSNFYEEEVLQSSQKFYFSIYYFNKLELVNDQKLKSYLSAWEFTLANVTNPVTTSRLQQNVTPTVEEYFGAGECEKVIGTRPVDAYFALDDKTGFILQVDGPSHYLHDDQGNYKQTPKTLFRNKFLAFFYPVVCIPYFKWEELVTDLQWTAYLKEIFKAVGIELPAQKWAFKKTSQPGTLFATYDGKDEKAPVSKEAPVKSKPSLL